MLTYDFCFQQLGDSGGVTFIYHISDEKDFDELALLCRVSICQARAAAEM